jgi:antitoxin component of MazEF toxin-antitoxin module
MKIMKIRRVGNSNVVSLPHELESQGFTAGTMVMVHQLPTGEVRIVPADRVHMSIREVGRNIVDENREALDMLADYEREHDQPVASAVAH